MANVASGVYPQMIHSSPATMVVPSPYHHYHHQAQHTPSHPQMTAVQSYIQVHEPKKEPPKKKKKISEKNEKPKKTKVIGNQSFLTNNNRFNGTNFVASSDSSDTSCSRCHKKKCFKHIDLR